MAGLLINAVSAAETVCNGYVALDFNLLSSYNAGKHFELCLQSALAKFQPNFDMLIADDGLTGGTLDIVNSYQQKHSNIRLVQNATKGMVANWENCTAAANRDWIKYLFQDDLMEPDCL